MTLSKPFNWAAVGESLTQHTCVQYRQTQHNVKAIGYCGGGGGRRMRPALRPGQVVVCNIPLLQEHAT
jgi:hypothetical protein